MLDVPVVPLAGFSGERTHRQSQGIETHTGISGNKVKVLTVRIVLLGLCGFNPLRGAGSRFRLTLCWLCLGFGLSLCWFGLSMSRVNILLSGTWAFLFTPRPLDTLWPLRDAKHGRVARSRCGFVAALSHGNSLRPGA